MLRVPFLHRWSGSCGQQIRANVQGAMKQNASPGAQSEAPRRRWKPGRGQHSRPKNRDSQHMLNQPRGSCPDKTIRRTTIAIPVVKLSSPQMWVRPQLPFGRFPRSPLQLESPSLKSQPFPPHPLPLSSAHPFGSFCNAPPEGGPDWRRGAGPGARGVDRWRGRALQAAFGARPSSGGA